ncbi:MAG: VPLPA-CTERM sorting domain-containing protein [Roseobacter sp.]
MNFKSILLGASMALLVAPAAASTLVANVTGTAGSDTTFWEFSGSTTATGTGSFSADSIIRIDHQFLDVGTFTDLSIFDVPEDGGTVSGIAQLMIGSDTRGIDRIFIDGDAGAGNDDIAFGVDGAGDFDFASGDLVSWSGLLTITGIGFDNVSLGGVPNTLTGLGLSGDSNLSLTVNISESVAPVPLPAGGLLLLSGLIGVAGLKRRRKRAA